MKSFFTIITVSLLLASCNNNDAPASPAPVKDTVAVSVPAKDSVTEEVAYEKRNINLPLTGWPAMQQQAHLDMSVKALKNDIPVTGDFNGDGQKETLQLVAPVADTTTKDAFQQCYGGACNSYVYSSTNSYPVLIVHDNLGDEMKNLGDLDGDGADELMVYPNWWQSNWNPYRIYSFSKTDQQWHYLVEPVSIFANDLYKQKIFVKKAKRAGYIMAYTSDSDIDGKVISAYKEFKIIK